MLSVPCRTWNSSNLLRFAREIDAKRSGEPSVLGVSSGEPTVLGVIVAGGYGYTREDGIQVIPITALGP